MIEIADVNPWFPWPGTNPQGSLRLFCFPFAGGGASVFRNWFQDLPPEIDVRPVQLPGRERRLMEMPYDHLDPLVAAVERALLPHLTMPFAFFGHCLGALIAFELSRRLRALYGIQPAWLFVAAHRAPHLPDRFAPSHRLPDAEFVAELRRRNGTREEVLANPGAMRLVLPLLRADFAVCETYLYRPRKALDCPITVFSGIADPSVVPEELESWAEHTSGPCNVCILPEDHFFIQTARSQLLQRLSQDLSTWIDFSRQESLKGEKSNGEPATSAGSREHNGMIADLRAFLRQHFPEYMIPAQFVLLPGLPLSVNGEIDLRALPSPDATDKEQQKQHVAPGTPGEEKLAQLWLDILRIEKIGIEDDFFASGGNSLRAIQLMAHIRSTFKIDVSLRTIFEHPTIRQLALYLASHARSSAVLSLRPVSGEKRRVLSFAQERLWFLYQIAPESAFYNIPILWQIVGPLDRKALTQSVQEIVRRHEILRTSIVVQDDGPTAEMREDWHIPLSLIDLSSLPEPVREHYALDLAQKEAHRAFDLAKDSMIRCTLIKLTEKKFFFLCILHHMTADQQSITLLGKELQVLYAAYLRGEISPLPAVSIQYGDYAWWQRQWLQGARREQLLAYWKSQLQDAPALLDFPTDFQRPAIQAYHGDVFTLKLGSTLAQMLKALSQRLDVTLFMVMLAAFKVLLYRYTRQSDILVGIPVANRTHSEQEHLIGFMLNTLVIRSRLEATVSFRQFLAVLKQTTLAAYEHQDLPFELLVQTLSPTRTLSYSPIFQVLFNMYTYHDQPLELIGLETTPLVLRTKTAQFDLSLDILEQKGELFASFEYNTELFQQSTIVQMADCYRTLLEGIVHSPEQMLSRLALMTPDRQQQLLQVWSSERRPYPRGKSIQHFFEQQVRRMPDAPAVVCAEHILTYEELNSRANALAHTLRKRGINLEAPVGIFTERSLELVIGLLGVLKAGGTFVPLDPTYPVERLVFLIQDSGIKLLLTQASLKSMLSAQALPALCLDTDWPSIASKPVHNPTDLTLPQHQAYVLYTSGSTGYPKGVLVEHQNVVNYSFATIDLYTIRPGDRVLQFGSIGFDVIIEEIFPFWFMGACVCLRPEHKTASLANFSHFVREQQLTILTLPVSFWYAWMNELAHVSEMVNVAFPSLRLLIAGTEAPLPKHLALWYKLGGNHLDWSNEYGITETTVTTTAYFLRAPWQWNATNQMIPMGKPLTNIETYVLDQHLQPVPPTLPGELYVGGKGVARGYLNRPYLTVERFLPNPYSTEPGQRLYKSGDVVRYLMDGNLAYLGRTDTQVKVRGFRIELDEIEATLMAHPAIKECVVIAQREAQFGTNRLVAYIVPTGQKGAVRRQELRRYLQALLPDYMVPAVFIELETMPLTVNDKIDRQALSRISGTALDREENFDEPRNGFEVNLACIWSEVLNLPQVSIHANFFELGGHSLLAAQLISRLNAMFQIALTLRQIFEAPTIAELAEVVMKELAAQIGDEVMAELLAKVQLR